MLRMHPHVWYKIIPSSSSDVENLAYATGQSWELIQNLRIHLNFINKYGKDFRLNHLKFESLKHIDYDNINVHIASARPDEGKKMSYICRESPIYDKPLSQNKTRYSFARLRYSDGNNNMLRKLLMGALNFDVNNID